MKEEIKEKTLQEHIWNSIEKISSEPYYKWDWVNVFEHFKLKVDDKEYKSWVKCLKDFKKFKAKKINSK